MPAIQINAEFSGQLRKRLASENNIGRKGQVRKEISNG
jgi:hypothetical protein